MKRIGREQHALQAQFGDQHLRRRDLVGGSRNFAMCEGQCGICGEGT